MRRFVPTLAAVLVIALCIGAGNWQRARMHAKEALRAQFDAAVAAAPIDADALPRASADWAALRYRPVLLQGEFDARRQILLDNRVQAGRVGYDVLAPLRLVDGRAVLVDRGWVALGRSRAELPSVPPPAGIVSVRGRIDLPPASYFELKPDVHAGAVWQHLDVARFALASGLDLLPVVIEQTAPAADGDGLVRSWPAPDFGIDTHRIYMVQWYAFAALAGTFWAIAHRPQRWRRSAPPAEERAHG